MKRLGIEFRGERLDAIMLDAQSTGSEALAG
jgi:hypothetical protein